MDGSSAESLFGKEKALPPPLFASNRERDVRVELVHRFERQNVAKRRLIYLGNTANDFDEEITINDPIT